MMQQQGGIVAGWLHPINLEEGNKRGVTGFTPSFINDDLCESVEGGGAH